MRKLRVGAQLIIWGERALKELPRVLDEVASIGYEGVEAGMRILSHYPNYKELFESRGLVLSGLHQGIQNEKKVKDALEMLKVMDAHYLIISGGRVKSKSGYLEIARTLEEIGKLAKEYDVKVCYHNHYWEIENDGLGIKTIIENTDPELVYLCMDTYWVKYGGMDPVSFMEENLDRIVYLHLKDGTEEDFKRRSFCELGYGIIDFKSIINLAKKGNVEWIVVEQDFTKREPRESMRISREYLKREFGL
ncbi:MAG: sugar phosphate isomerase/epimerase [Thermoprotei archaeon]|nr:sugar phosphate isomerase/epimerase [Thermoprotei archaeon]